MCLGSCSFFYGFEFSAKLSSRIERLFCGEFS